MKDSTAIWQVESSAFPRPARLCLDHGLKIVLENRNVRKTKNIGEKGYECDLCRGLRDPHVVSVASRGWRATKYRGKRAELP